MKETIPKEVQAARFDLNGERAERTLEYASTRVHEKAKMGSLKSEGYIVESGGRLTQSARETIQALDELAAAVKARLANSETIIEALKQKCQHAENQSAAARTILDQVIPELEILLKEMEEKQCQ